MNNLFSIQWNYKNENHFIGDSIPLIIRIIKNNKNNYYLDKYYLYFNGDNYFKKFIYEINLNQEKIEVFINFIIQENKSVCKNFI